MKQSSMEVRALANVEILGREKLDSDRPKSEVKFLDRNTDRSTDRIGPNALSEARGLSTLQVGCRPHLTNRALSPCTPSTYGPLQGREIKFEPDSHSHSDSDSACICQIHPKYTQIHAIFQIVSR